MPQPQAIFWTSLYCSNPTWISSGTQPTPFQLPHHIWRYFHGNRNWRSGLSNPRLQPWGLNRWSPDGASPQRESYSYLSEWPNPRKAHRRNDKANKKNCKNHWIPKYEWNKCHRQGRSNCQHLLIVLSTKILRQVWKTTIHYCLSIICICICTIKSQCVVVKVGTDRLRRGQAKLLEKKSSVLELRRPPVTLSSYQIK